jgi:hypothetical protein
MAIMSVGRRLVYAFRCFFALIWKGVIPPDILEAAQAAPRAVAASPAAAPAPAVVEDAGERAVQLLALLQRDGRLVDFLFEDVTPYTDAQIGAAVREVHANCRRAVDRYLPLEPILADAEGQATTIGAPVDPSAIKLIGNVGAQSSYRGTVRHRGWRTARLALPPLPAPGARLVVTPAEVEIG